MTGVIELKGRKEPYVLTWKAEAPMPCIEYVVWHELTHFLHQDHSPAFYAALAKVIPDWRQRRESLNAYSYREL